MGITEKVKIAFDGKEGLDYLQTTVDGESPQPALIFLDINMPNVDGWDFLEEYAKLEDVQKSKIVIIMLTTSLNMMINSGPNQTQMWRVLLASIWIRKEWKSY